MPVNYKKYPPNWHSEIRPRILVRAGEIRDPITNEIIIEAKCEFEGCTAVNHFPHPDTGSPVVLTIAHLDHDPGNWEVNDDRLKAGCQRCHLKYDHWRHVRKRVYGCGVFEQPTLFK